MTRSATLALHLLGVGLAACCPGPTDPPPELPDPLPVNVAPNPPPAAAGDGPQGDPAAGEGGSAVEERGAAGAEP
jgi:hypothetical protein